VIAVAVIKVTAHFPHCKHA